MKRTLGRSGIEVSAIGVGCWALGGPMYAGDHQLGWGRVDDQESVAALRRAFDLGATFFDTASNYGGGHSEEVLGRALAGRRDQAVIATKWGYTFDPATGEMGPPDLTEDYLRACLDGCLRRLGTDYVDLYQLHVGEAPVEVALDLIGALEDLVAAGKIRAYGWSTDDPGRAAAFAAAGPHCAAVQHDHSVLRDAAEVVAVCEAAGVASIARGPLAMGLLSGKYHDGRRIGAQDVRGHRRGEGPEWVTYFTDGAGDPAWLARIDAVRDILASGGRTLAQGALSWLLARSPATVPIPGCRTVAQAEENLGTLQATPLTADEAEQVAAVLRA